MYFECNIDPRIPQYYHPEIYPKLVSTVALIHERTDKLNLALDDCILKGCKTRGATFAKIAKTVFDLSTKKFDDMIPAELAEVGTFYTMVTMLKIGSNGRMQLSFLTQDS